MNIETADVLLNSASVQLRVARSALSSPCDRDDVLEICRNTAQRALKAFLLFWGDTCKELADLTQLLERAAQIEPGYLTWLDCTQRLSNGLPSYDDGIDEAWEDADAIVKQTIAFCPLESSDEKSIRSFS